MEKLEAKFSSLIMSIASSALMAMGHSTPLQLEKIEVNPNLARFNIDLLIMLSDKTKANLTSEESKLLEHIIQDLQQKFIKLTS